MVDTITRLGLALSKVVVDSRIQSFDKVVVAQCVNTFKRARRTMFLGLHGLRSFTFTLTSSMFFFERYCSTSSEMVPYRFVSAVNQK